MKKLLVKIIIVFVMCSITLVSLSGCVNEEDTSIEDENEDNSTEVTSKPHYPIFIGKSIYYF